MWVLPLSNLLSCLCSLFGSIQEEVVQDTESVRLQQQAHQQQHSCTLDECFQLYTKEEQVHAMRGGVWSCTLGLCAGASGALELAG